MDFLGQLFDTSDFPARWNCGHWTTSHGWLHILSDLGVWSAYFAIPIVLCYFIFRRHDLPFRKVFVLFGAFILLCGTTHLMDAVIFWWPAYRLSGLLKLLTASVSWVTVFALVKVAPRVLSMRTPEELEREIAARNDAERLVREANAVLEQRVAMRTAELSQAMLSLERERELLHTTLGSIGDAVISTDASGNVTYLNAVAEALTGWTNSDTNGVPLSQVFHIVSEETRQVVENPTMRVLKEGIVVGLSNHTLLIAKDGTERPIDDSAAPIRSKEGDVVGCVLVFRDVKERRQLERQNAERLQASQLLSSVVDSSDDAIISKSLEGIIQSWNMSAERLFGYTAAEAVGRHISLVIPEDRLHEEDQIMQLIRNGSRVDQLDTVRLQRDGRPIHVALSISPIRDSEGKIVGVSKIARDITDRKIAEESLRQSAARLNSILRQSPAGIVLTDTDGRMKVVNQRWCEMLGYSEEELLSKTVIEVTHESSVVKTIDAFSSLAAGGQNFQIEKTYRRKDGSLLSAQSNVTALQSAEGEFVGLIAVVMDITERLRIEAELRSKAHFLQRIAEIMPGILQVFDLVENRSVFINHAAVVSLLGYSLEQVLAMDADVVRTLMHPDDLSRFEQHLDVVSALGEGEIADFEFRMRDRAGQWHWFHSQHAIFLRDEAGAGQQIIGVATEISERKRSEEILARLAAIVQSSEDGLFAEDLEGIVTSWNHGAEQIFGYSEEEIVGTSIMRLIPPEFQAEEFELQRKIAFGERVGHFDTMRIDKSGRMFPASITVSPLTDSANKLIGTARVIRNITDRKRVEETLRASEQRLDQGTRVAGLALAEIDYETGMNHLSAEAARQFGLGENAMVVSRERVHDTFHPHDRERLMRLIDASLDPNGEGSLATDHRVVWPTGEVRWLRVRKQVFFDGDGSSRRPGHAVLAAFDITTEKHVEERLRLFEKVILQMHDVVVITEAEPIDMPGPIIIYVNPAFTDLTGYTADEAIGKSPRFLQGPKCNRRELDKVRAALNSKQSAKVEVTNYRKDGTEFENEFEIVPVADESGCITHWVSVQRDITDRKRTEEELRRLASVLSEADRRKDEFLATLAHELRNPLAPIRSGLQIMQLTNGDTEETEQIRTMMERQVGQMVHLIDDLLDVSRISRGKLDLRKQRIALLTVINNAVETSRPLIEASGHELTVDLPPDPILVNADPTRLAQVFSNILNNAAKYSERGKTIRLNVAQEGGDVVVSVKDTGIGIPPDMLPKIFEMFTQVDRSLEKSQGGLGIGLSLARRLVEMHGGSIEARSEGDGRGSEFVVRLPLELTTTEENKLGVVEGQTGMLSAQRRILVADDNQDAANTLAMMLKLMGNHVLIANDGLQAVQVTEEFKPDLIFLDIGMPMLNGYEVCRRIRQQDWGKSIVIIALTGFGQDDDKRRSKEAGFDHHFVKPLAAFALKELLSK